MADSRTKLQVLITGDNRSVIRALTEVGDKSKSTASTISRDSRTSSDSFDRVGRSASRLHGIIGGLAGTIGLGGLAVGLKDSITGGMRLTTAQNQLQAALKATGQAGGDTGKRLQEAAESLSTQGGFGTTENLQALTQYVRSTGNASTALQRVKQATDIARGSGKDLISVTRALALAEQGRTTGLTRLGIVAPKVTTAEDVLKQKRANAETTLKRLTAAGDKFTAAQRAQYTLSTQISPAMEKQAKAQDALATKTKVLATLQRYSGGTAAFAKGPQGQISNLQNAVHNLSDAFGQGLRPVVTKVGGVLTSLVSWFGKNRTVLYALLGAVGAVSAVLTAHAAITEVVKAKNYLLLASNQLLGTSFEVSGAAEEGATAATFSFGAAMDALPILALITGLVLIATHFKTVEKIATEAWQGIKIIASATFDWIKGTWPQLEGILTAPFTFTASLITGAFRKITGAVGTVVGWIKSAWYALGDVLTWPFKQLINIADRAWSAIRQLINIPGKIGGMLGSVANTLSFGLFSSGGVVKPKYLAMGGGPFGSDTVPAWLTPGEGIVSAPAMQQLGRQGLDSINHGGAPAPAAQIVELHHQTVLDGKVLAQSVVRHALRQAARGPASHSGGSLLSGTR